MPNEDTRFCYTIHARAKLISRNIWRSRIVDTVLTGYTHLSDVKSNKYISSKFYKDRGTLSVVWKKRSANQVSIVTAYYYGIRRKK